MTNKIYLVEIEDKGLYYDFRPGAPAGWDETSRTVRQLSITNVAKDPPAQVKRYPDRMNSRQLWEDREAALTLADELESYYQANRKYKEDEKDAPA